jgi:carboxyl-terminal processing protease
MSSDTALKVEPEAGSPRPRSLFDMRVFFLLILTAGVAFLGGVWFASATNSPHNNADFRIFWQSWDILDHEYYYQLPKNTDLVYAAAEGLIAAAGDHYTFFAPPAKGEIDRQVMAGEFGGIGAYVSQDQAGQLVIAAPFSGLPAEQAGLKAGDVVLEVDGVSPQGLSLDDAAAHLRGAIGTKVELTVYRPSDGSQFQVEITRAKVEMPTVQSARYGDVGYVRLFIFNDLATSSLEREIKSLENQGAKALILDLRGNPGGLLDQAVSVSDLFLGEGVVVTQRDREGEEIVYRSTDGGPAEQIPLVVLIDGGSASASEVVAGALKDRGRAALIGQTSFGKGSVQHVHDMEDGSQLHVTAALWFTPDGTAIQGKGLTPDVAVTVPDSPETGQQDPYIGAALTYFKDQGIAQGEQ